jgi:hypothetical protein
MTEMRFAAVATLKSDIGFCPALEMASFSVFSPMSAAGMLHRDSGGGKSNRLNFEPREGEDEDTSR